MDGLICKIVDGLIDDSLDGQARALALGLGPPLGWLGWAAALGLVWVGWGGPTGPQQRAWSHEPLDINNR